MQIFEQSFRGWGANQHLPAVLPAQAPKIRRRGTVKLRVGEPLRRSALSQSAQDASTLAPAVHLLRGAVDQPRQPPIGWIAVLRAERQLPLGKRLVVVESRGLDRIVLGRVGLDDDSTVAAAAPGAT